MAEYEFEITSHIREKVLVDAEDKEEAVEMLDEGYVAEEVENLSQPTRVLVAVDGEAVGREAV